MPLYPKELPEKYYLEHFNEIVGFVLQHCQHLLAPEHQRFIHIYQQLEEDAQCILVRVINRQSRFIQIDKMHYQEIADCPKQLNILVKMGLLKKLASDDISAWLNELTKLQLLELVQQYTLCGIKKSASKQAILEQVVHACHSTECLNSDLAQQYLVKNFEHTLNYLVFLFFGNTHSALNKFSMRDLGVLKTRKNSGEGNARFVDLNQAQRVFYYSFKLTQLKNNQLDIQQFASNPASPADHPKVIENCTQSAQLQDEYFYLLGKRLLVEQHGLALQYLSASKSAKAQEKWLRELYKLGKKDSVKAKLEDIIDHSLDDALLLFAEDFYQRKFKQCKVSKLTEKLRQESYLLNIDLIYKDQVEKGVKRHYQNLGAIVYRTENRLFNALFGLTFWQELFDQQTNAVCSEFDRRPKVLKDNTIYQELGKQIEQRLHIFVNPKNAIAYLTKVATQFYGQPNGMFRWNSKMMQVIATFLQSAPQQAVVSHLRAMAQNYQGLNDGYPDLMIVENGQVRFEEVKAPGDVIRPNQFVTINALQQSGFEVQLCRVEWCVDPMQPYVVVDVETTGGKQPQHRITEIGAVKMINGEVVDTWTSLINPQRHISAFITKLTSISNEMVKDAPLFSEVADSLTEFMQNCVFVAHNVNFDYGFFKQEYQRLERNFVMPKLCTVRETRKHFPGLSSYSLGNLTKHFDIPLENHHRALCDAQAAAELLKLTQQKQS